ncbi:MAG: hypothetical protein OXH98_07235 [Caldilineaceae bacterium]|nr:hypothetical protein [Caldilineaceae bacterium]
MKSKRTLQAWGQQPGEPNPSYVAFVLYLSLGSKREQIIDSGVGRQMWRTLKAGIDRMQDDTPLPLACDIISAVLKNMLCEDALEQINKSGSDFHFYEYFHNGLHGDEQLHSAVESMLSNLEKVKNGQELPPLSYPSSDRIMRDVERFLEKS